MNISDHITYAEATKSQTAIRKGLDNKPDAGQLADMKYIANKVFEPLREAMGNKSIAINSFFRSAEVNRSIGGSSSSQHCKGQAMDIDGDVYGGVKNSDIFNYIKDNLQFDQLIWEFDNNGEPSWVHVSLNPAGQNRKQCLEAYKDNNGITTYRSI